MKAQNHFTTFLVFISITLFSSLNFANKGEVQFTHSGNCDFQVSNTGKNEDYMPAGKTFMTAQVEGIFRELDLSQNRYFVATTHQNFDQEKAQDILDSNPHANPSMFKHIRAVCGENIFELERIKVNSKPLTFGINNKIEADGSNECHVDKNIINKNNVSEKFILQSCDLSVYKITNNNISKSNYKSIRGFDPRYIERSEIKNVIIQTNKIRDQKILKLDCKVQNQYGGALEIECDNIFNFKTDEDINAAGIASGSVVLATSLNDRSKIRAPNGIPKAVGVVTKHSVTSDEKKIIFNIDTNELSKEYEALIRNK